MLFLNIDHRNSLLSFLLLFFQWVFLFSFDQSSIFPRNPQKVFRTKYSFISFSQNNIICADKKLNSILYGSFEIDFNYNITALSHARDNSFFFR